MWICESEGPRADCGSVYTASVILALFPGQLMWRAGADWCAQLCTAAADLCETMLSVFPALYFSRKSVCVCGFGRHSQEASGSAEADLASGQNGRRRRWEDKHLMELNNMILRLYFSLILILDLKKKCFSTFISIYQRRPCCEEVSKKLVLTLGSDSSEVGIPWSSMLVWDLQAWAVPPVYYTP